VEIIMKILVAGAGGFIGGHLVKNLLENNCTVRAIDCKPFHEWHQIFDSSENLSLDLSLKSNCDIAASEVNQVYNLACNMGGIGFIEKHRTECMFSVLINTHLLQSSIMNKVGRYFYSSTACVYNKTKQSSINVIPLKEEDAYPALPEAGYGWEKLFSEQMCLEAANENLIQIRIARLHNVYGPHGTWFGGREKAPAAISRKIAMVNINKNDSIEIWGNGEQIRSFMHIDDCVYGIKKIMNSNIIEPINLGSSETISINNLVDIIENIAGVKTKRIYNLNAPLGVVGRSSDNTKIKNYLNWEPSISLKNGLKTTYDWIYQQCKNQF
jgi:nucleoside-diphosphate-sugar epimerase